MEYLRYQLTSNAIRRFFKRADSSGGVLSYKKMAYFNLTVYEINKD